MKLSTEYREESVGTFKGTKDHYLVGHVEFSEEERAIIQERGLYDEIIMIPGDAGLPSKGTAIGIRILKVIGLILMPLGLLFSCTQLVAPDKTGAGATPFLMLFIGAGLFGFGWYREKQALKTEADPSQTLTLRRLLTKPDFMVHAYSPQQARDNEAVVRELFGSLAQRIRESASAPEKNTYEL